MEGSPKRGTDITINKILRRSFCKQTHILPALLYSRVRQLEGENVRHFRGQISYDLTCSASWYHRHGGRHIWLYRSNLVITFSREEISAWGANSLSCGQELLTFAEPTCSFTVFVKALHSLYCANLVEFSFSRSPHWQQNLCMDEYVLFAHVVLFIVLL
jgi:hypothetical protein